MNYDDEIYGFSYLISSSSLIFIVFPALGITPPGQEQGAPDPRRGPVRHGGCKRGKGPKVAKFLDR